MKNLDKTLARIAEIKKQIAELEGERKELEASVIEHLESVQLVTIDWGPDRKNKATIVYGSSMKIDATGLRDDYGGSEEAVCPSDGRKVRNA